MDVMKIAVVQLESAIADVAENLRRCEALGDEAGAAGAQWIVLPEFFTTGMGFDDAMTHAALPPDGAGLQLLRTLAIRHGATTGGSFICRDADGHNRNAFFLVGPDGTVLGRHDKDLPTMWENCFYVGGDDDGVIEAGEGITAGAAVCWEFMRTQTARRLRGRVDLLVGGSAWWSIPAWPPRAVTRRLEAANARTAAGIAPAMARAVGAPVAHAAHCGPVSCGLPWAPGIPYNGHFQGGAVICDAAGTILARRDNREGPGVVVADVEPGRTAPLDAVSDRFWMHPRGVVASALWTYQNAHGRPWYRRHTLGRPTADVVDPRLRIAAVDMSAERRANGRPTVPSS
jgi:predicted amidohydrolase